MSNEETALSHSDHPEYGNTPCTDRRGRLYVRTTGTGDKLWHCKDCGQGGRLRGDQSARSPGATAELFRQLRAGKTIISTPSIVLPPDSCATLPIPAQLWLRKYEITSEEQHEFHLSWSAAYQRLILPVYDPHGALIYWQGRTFKPVTKENPKYLNIRQQGARNVHFRRFCPDDPRRLCIVEDILSAIKLGRWCSSLALLGSYLPVSLDSVLKGYDRIYIWLDLDKLRTSLHAMQMLTQKTGKPIIPIWTLVDPKACSETIIQTKLNL